LDQQLLDPSALQGIYTGPQGPYQADAIFVGAPEVNPYNREDTSLYSPESMPSGLSPDWLSEQSVTSFEPVEFFEQINNSDQYRSPPGMSTLGSAAYSLDQGNAAIVFSLQPNYNQVGMQGPEQYGYHDESSNPRNPVGQQTENLVYEEREITFSGETQGLTVLSWSEDQEQYKHLQDYANLPFPETIAEEDRQLDPNVGQTDTDKTYTLGHSRRRTFSKREGHAKP
jgi:hypothetical protein